ncbi:hypothetical protein CI15_00320 [Paraburkholderia monticola]|uniref:CD-NTase-associated protein 12/Pycsar effector protein TIR domain-containing protein n=1 Tax=Paraburkholderia monticola TaxID=1399968 RepID=A0A149Q179_9BURK|nr:nucleotide-binding protein [Paraburkholderia monticola]KXU91078.1 hypothetical protein CI15_00320 [Paraburkholderia monticola]
MTTVAIAMAKLAGIQGAVRSALSEKVGRGGMTIHERSNFDPGQVGQYFDQAAANLATLRTELPNQYEDFVLGGVSPETQMSLKDAAGNTVFHYSRQQMERLARDIAQIIEIQVNSGEVARERKSPRRVFISHGRAKDWYEVQAHIERDLKIETMELAQEVSGSLTIVEKLETRSDDCDSAVIVMSGDDTDEEGKPKVRENVMHEIGFFHGKFGRQRVILLHEEGVSIPTNLAGIVYARYPNGTVQATFHVIDRELKALYNL